MSAIIKGIKIPKYIGEHKEFDRYGGFLTVYENGKVGLHIHIFDTDYTIESIPTPHGRLIDADRLMEVIEKNSYLLKGYYNSLENGMFFTGIKQAIDEAPTIIEAEVE